MPAPLSLDLRNRVLAHAEASGHGRVVLGRVFGIGSATAYRWLRVERADLFEPPTPMPHGPAPKIPDARLGDLKAVVAEKPDRTLAELCTCWAAKTGVVVKVSTMHRALERAAITLKKNETGRAPNAPRRHRGEGSVHR